MIDSQKERFADALARVAGDAETLVMLAGIAAEDGPPMIVQLTQQMSEGNRTAYARTAHALKGLLSTFDTGEPVSEIQPVIDVARKGETSAWNKMHADLQPKIERLLIEIESLAKAP